MITTTTTTTTTSRAARLEKLQRAADRKRAARAYMRAMRKRAAAQPPAPPPAPDQSYETTMRRLALEPSGKARAAAPVRPTAVRPTCECDLDRVFVDDETKRRMGNDRLGRGQRWNLQQGTICRRCGLPKRPEKAARGVKTARERAPA